eukprot:scaffold55825_cov27-Tisochrysis_lutea.AAC.3
MHCECAALSALISWWPHHRRTPTRARPCSGPLTPRSDDAFRCLPNHGKTISTSYMGCEGRGGIIRLERAPQKSERDAAEDVKPTSMRARSSAAAVLADMLNARSVTESGVEAAATQRLPSAERNMRRNGTARRCRWASVGRRLLKTKLVCRAGCPSQLRRAREHAGPLYRGGGVHWRRAARIGRRGNGRERWRRTSRR